MKITVLVTLMVFLAYFLVLYGGVGFIQDKRFFSSAPKENLDAIPDTKERFPGAHSMDCMSLKVMMPIPASSPTFSSRQTPVRKPTTLSFAMVRMQKL